MLKTGAARVAITPPLEMPIGGFGEWNQRPFTGIAAEIYARAVVLEQGPVRAAIVSVEVTECSERVRDLIRESITTRTGIPAGNTLLVMTHNHSGPLLERPSIPYVQVAAQKIADAVVLAAEGMRPAHFDWNARAIPGPATNRRILLCNGHVWPRFFLGPQIPTRENADAVFAKMQYAPHVDYRSVPPASEIVGPGPVDPRLAVFQFRDLATGTPIASLAHYGCHASVALESRNVHGDFPGFACSCIEDAYGGICLFLPGPSANVNCNAFLRERTDAEARRIGSGFAGEMLACLAGISGASPDPALILKNARTCLPLREEMNPERNRALRDALSAEPDSDQAKEAAQTAREITTLQRFAREAFHDDVTRTGKQEIEITSLVLGPVTFLTNPGELFVETGQRIRRLCSQREVFLISHCNGQVGYIPERAAFGQGGYEDAPSHCSFVGPASEDLILNACRSLLSAG